MSCASQPGSAHSNEVDFWSRSSTPHGAPSATQAPYATFTPLATNTASLSTSSGDPTIWFTPNEQLVPVAASRWDGDLFLPPGVEATGGVETLAGFGVSQTGQSVVWGLGVSQTQASVQGDMHGDMHAAVRTNALSNGTAWQVARQDNASGAHTVSLHVNYIYMVVNHVRRRILAVFLRSLPTPESWERCGTPCMVLR